MKINKLIVSILLLFVFVSCAKENDVDREKPVIDLTRTDAFPVNCDTLYFGEPFLLNVLFTDNAELGSYSIDIHNNFDHHSHSTEISECNIAANKDPVNPYLFISDYSIPDGETNFNTNISISIPSGDGNGLYDEGDYHFYISLTDKEGWSTQKGLNIKMLHR